MKHSTTAQTQSETRCIKTHLFWLSVNTYYHEELWIDRSNEADLRNRCYRGCSLELVPQRATHARGEKINELCAVPEVLIARTYDTCCIGHRLINLVPRVPGLFGQWVSVQGDSEIVDAIFPENVVSSLAAHA